MLEYVASVGSRAIVTQDAQIWQPISYLLPPVCHHSCWCCYQEGVSDLSVFQQVCYQGQYLEPVKNLCKLCSSQRMKLIIYADVDLFRVILKLLILGYSSLYV